MKTDSIFYQLFQTLPYVLFELLGESPEKAAQYKFSSVEVKELSRTIDGLFLPSDKVNPLYLVEVQFQKDENFYYRFITEVFVYLGQYKPEMSWQGVVIWAKRSLEPPIPNPYQILFSQNLIQRIYLDEIGERSDNSIGLGIIELVVVPEQRAVEQLKRLTENTKKTITDNSVQKEVIELIEKIIIYKFPLKSKKELEAMFGLAEWKKTQFYQDVMEEGLKRGKLEGKLETIPRLLDLRLSPEQIAKILEIDLKTVVQAIDELNKK